MGTCGYFYNEWIGPVYPKGTRQEDYFPLYSGRFSTVELDFSYYAMPQAGQLEAIEPLLREKRLEKVLFQFPPEGASRPKYPNADTAIGLVQQPVGCRISLAKCLEIEVYDLFKGEVVPEESRALMDRFCEDITTRLIQTLEDVYMHYRK